MVAVHSGTGQIVDVNLLETMFQLMGPLVSLYGVTGEQQPRLGAGLPYTVPRGTYRCRAMYRPEGEPPLVSDTVTFEVR